MTPLTSSGGRFRLAMMFGWLAAAICSSSAQSTAAAPVSGEIRIVELQGTAEISPKGATTWVLTQTNQILHPFDRLRTGPNSRLALLWSDQSVVPFGALTEIEILPPHAPAADAGLHIIRGILSFFHRDKPGRIRVITRGAVAGIEGTEFMVAVANLNDRERATFSVIDGRVQVTPTSMQQAMLVLTNGQQAVVQEGQAPVMTAGFVANNVLQWCFYYPAVLDLADLSLTEEQKGILSESINAYRQGDLLAALNEYPAMRRPTSDAERVYYAALLLSVGQVEESETTLANSPAADVSTTFPRLAAALRQLVAAVKGSVDAPIPATPAEARKLQLATELLSASYYEQSRGIPDLSLKAALSLARQAVTNSPEFGFAWARVAELEFSFGRREVALEALDRSLALTPRNAQALALKGFLLAAERRTREAIEWFDRAIAVDSALGNAWLGRGLCKIRRGDAPGGREDLLVAAALEPQRALLRSYLGKAYANEGDLPKAAKELQLAKQLDAQDPTSWLYSALVNQQRNRVNEAIGDLEKSQDLNDNRSVYRSQLLLDQDRAVRSANLAAIYRDAGMIDWSAREASKAVSYDYANYSAHLFLANSYNELRDPNRINLRYETPAESEYLIANLLAPVGAGTLAASISQEEYSRLLERDRLGVVSSTEYLSRGAWAERGAQYGTRGDSAYAVEGSYRTDPGQRPNNDFEETAVQFHFKQQITPDDAVYLRGVYYHAEGGDLVEYSDPAMAFPNLRTKEDQEPILSLGYHHEWAPGIHTLLLVSRLVDDLSVVNPNQPAYLTITPPGEPPVVAWEFSDRLQYRSRLEIYSTELQQLWQGIDHTTILGGRFQIGDFHTQDLLTDPAIIAELAAFFDTPMAEQDYRPDFERVSFYGYHYWQVLPALQIAGGLTYDWLKFPENFRGPPISSKEQTDDRLSPKAGFIWTPLKDTVVRFAYTRSLAGASIDQTFLLEPSQVAGFNQSFRSIMPESVVGAEAGARFETFGVALEQRFSHGTYLGIQGQILNSHVDRTLGTFDYTGEFLLSQPSGTPNSLDYTERSVVATVNQLVGRDWSLGASYRLTQADLTSDFSAIPNDPNVTFANFAPYQKLSAVLHQVSLNSLYNLPCGFFADFQAQWYRQSSQGYNGSLPGDDFWQFNAFAGYRFPGRKAELRIGLLNLTDQDYRLNPLTLYNELPRERTLAARFQFNF